MKPDVHAIATIAAILKAGSQGGSDVLHRPSNDAFIKTAIDLLSDTEKLVEECERKLNDG